MKKQNLPKQSAPVIRRSSSATISGEQGVEASIIPFLPIAATLLSNVL
ncbi:MAG: hypothetical protein WBG70_09110 [Spirulinaceae cyanobacterium]